MRIGGDPITLDTSQRPCTGVRVSEIPGFLGILIVCSRLFYFHSGLSQTFRRALENKASEY